MDPELPLQDPCQPRGGYRGGALDPDQVPKRGLLMAHTFGAQELLHGYLPLSPRRCRGARMLPLGGFRSRRWRLGGTCSTWWTSALFRPVTNPLCNTDCPER